MTCERAYHRTAYVQREQGKNGTLAVVDGVPIVRRIMSATARDAESRYKGHLRDCAASGGAGCLARIIDPYDRRRICLIRAVLREDWDQLRRADRGMPFKREVTTADGRWIDAPIPAPVRFMPLVTVDAFIAAGGAKTQEETRTIFWGVVAEQNKRDAAYEAKHGEKPWWA
jgi:hypothetical protein